MNTESNPDNQSVQKAPKNSLHDRRSFLRASLALSAATVSSQTFASNSETDNVLSTATERRLRLLNVHTRERLDVVYWKDGNYIADHIGQLNYFMRDHHVNEAARMHPALYDKLFQLHTALETDARLHVLSGFRTTATNEKLRNLSNRVSRRVAQQSFHIRGRAVDFIIPGVDSNTIQKKARNMRLGGVGYYTKGHFVHLDTGYPRHWIMP